MPSPDLPRRRLVRPGALPRARLVQLPGVFGINRNARSASAEIGVRLPRKSAFGLVRNRCSFSSVLHTKALDGAGVPPRFPIQPPVYGAYTLLSGLSLELLAKAVLIERNPTLVDQGRLTKWRDNGHGLVGLLEQVGILLDAEDIYLAERLGESVVWAGRYPIPWNASGMAPRQTPQGDMAAPGDFHPDRDPSRATVIWERLENALIREWQERAPLKAAAWHAIKTGELPGLPGIGMSKE